MMKKIYTILVPIAIGILLTATVCLPQQVKAQSPEKMSYQAVIRNSSDQLVTNQDIGMQISILQGTATGTAIYVETHSTVSNANGLVTIEIGNGTTSDDFSAIDWANGSYFIKTETDPAGGTNYTITGTSQLLSVPYALHAKTAESITGGISETDPIYTSSQAANITATDITNLSNLSGTNTGDQNLTQVLAQSNLANTQIKNVTDPTEAQDAATKAYVDEMLIRAGVYTIKDFDGNIYNTVKIGDQIWMTENLKVSHYPNGDTIPHVTDNTIWANLDSDNTSDAYCYYNNNASNEAPTYGALYTYAAAIGDNWERDNKDAQGVCPDEWHLPTNAEWDELETYLGANAGSKLAGNEPLWTNGNLDQNADFGTSGFSALPGGHRHNMDGSFGLLEIRGVWRISTGDAISLKYNITNVSSGNSSKSAGLSVRCVMD